MAEDDRGAYGGNPLERGPCRKSGRPKTEDRTSTNTEVHMRSLILPMLLLAATAPMAGARQSVTVARPARIFTSNRSDDGDRAMLGIATGSIGKRDTLGLLIESITPGSPAEEAGAAGGER